MIQGLSSLHSRAVLGYMFHMLRGEPDSGWIQQVAGTVIPSNMDIETYAGLGATAPLRQWNGPRLARTIKDATYAIENIPYEGTIEVTGDEIRLDKTGQVQRRIDDLRVRYNEHWEQLLTTLILGGESGAASLCYDGQSFFDTDHPETGTNQSNDVGSNIGTPSDPTAAEMEAAIFQNVQAMLAFQDDQGQPCNSGLRSFTVMIPTNMLKAATAALNAPFIADGSVGPRTNVLTVLGGFQFLLSVNPRLTNNDRFYTFANTGSALIRQEQLAGMLGALDESSDHFFKHDRLQFGIFTKRGVGYGDWKQAILHTFT